MERSTSENEGRCLVLFLIALKVYSRSHNLVITHVESEFKASCCPDEITVQEDKCI